MKLWNWGAIRPVAGDKGPEVKEAAALRRQLADSVAAKARAEAELARLTKPPEPFTPGKQLVCAIPYCGKDLAATLALLRWMDDLGGCKNHDAVVCSPHGIEPEAEIAVVNAAKGVFRSVAEITTSFDLPVEGWPTGTVWSFLHIARYCRENELDFWLNEPDCIPLKAGWLDAIEAEYRACGRPYLGFIEPAHPAGHYPRHMTGNGVYHWEVFRHVRADKLGVAWDVAMADVLTPQCAQSKLFHQEFGPLDHPPTFPTRASLDRIPKGAAVFHRCKDGTLIDQLRRRRTEDGGRV